VDNKDSPSFVDLKDKEVDLNNKNFGIHIISWVLIINLHWRHIHSRIKREMILIV
jgi:hypothetical protein